MTGPVPTLVLPYQVAAKIVQGEGEDKYIGPSWMRGPPRLTHEVQDWCRENMQRSVVLLFGTGSLRYEVSFGCETDHVLFKLRWY
jgi:hypothetical protein